LLQDDLDLESKFTETHFDDKVANVLDNLKVMASKRNAFESYITNAIANETFENIKDQLKEDELMEFDTPHAKLGHQVSRLGFNAKDEKLGNYLHSISSKLNAGGQLSQFEYGAIKSSLLSAGQHNVQTAPMTATESYEAFLDQFII
jgi:phospholipid N-methyltransferase